MCTVRQIHDNQKTQAGRSRCWLGLPPLWPHLPDDDDGEPAPLVVVWSPIRTTTWTSYTPFAKPSRNFCCVSSLLHAVLFRYSAHVMRPHLYLLFQWHQQAAAAPPEVGFASGSASLLSAAALASSIFLNCMFAQFTHSSTSASTSSVPSSRTNALESMLTPMSFFRRTSLGFPPCCA